MGIRLGLGSGLGLGLELGLGFGELNPRLPKLHLTQQCICLVFEIAKKIVAKIAGLI